MIKYFLFFLMLPVLLQAQINIFDKIEKEIGQFPIIEKIASTTIFYDMSENILVKKVANFLADDIDKVSGKRPEVGDHIKTTKSRHKVETTGRHTLKVWAIDPAIVFQKFVVNSKGKPKVRYLGAPECLYIKPL